MPLGINDRECGSNLVQPLPLKKGGKKKKKKSNWLTNIIINEIIYYTSLFNKSQLQIKDALKICWLIIKCHFEKGYNETFGR